MKKLLPIAFALLASLAAPRPAHATWTAVQHVFGECAGGTICTIATSATAAGNAGIVTLTTPTPEQVTVSGVSGGGTWTAPSSCISAPLNYGIASAAYSLSLPSGATSFTVAFSGYASGDVRVDFFELNPSAGGSSFGGCATSIAFSCNVCAVPSITAAGNNAVVASADFTAGAPAPTNVTSPYAVPSDPSWASDGAPAYALNQTGTVSGSWTLEPGEYRADAATVIALTETSGGSSSGGMPAVY